MTGYFNCINKDKCSFLWLGVSPHIINGFKCVLHHSDSKFRSRSTKVSVGKGSYDTDSGRILRTDDGPRKWTLEDLIGFFVVCLLLLWLLHIRVCHPFLGFPKPWPTLIENISGSSRSVSHLIPREETLIYLDGQVLTKAHSRYRMYPRSEIVVGLSRGTRNWLHLVPPKKV